MPSITDSIGRVLGDRYRLVRALGTGASAHVYLADDVSLHRRVAIKVLHPALAGDSSFLRRFRSEAHTVAALSHPNILQVFDWGEEDGQPYLVLEYLGGGSLRQIYDTGVLLSPEQAVQVGLQAAAGLEYAHRRGLVHRDIKPANLLFDADRRLRIADFGLARALAEASWTEPDGAILGTARYSAPEQVEGWVLDGKADVYALALVLYEGVAGEPAFIGDTTVATLMARVGTLLPEHEALGRLNDVLVWAAAPDPAERYDAAELALRLRAIELALPRPDPLPIVVEGMAVGTDRATVDPGERPAPLDDAVNLTELGAPAPEGKRTGGFTDGTTPPRARRRWWRVALIGTVAAALVAAGAYLAVENQVFTPSHPVPLVVGKSVVDARAAVAADKFTVRTTGHRTSLALGAGLILSQRPAARAGGATVTAKEGSTIDVVVSSGPPLVAIPDLTSFTSCNQAVQALEAVHLVGVCPASSARYSSTVVTGAVIGSSPAGTAPYRSTVVVITSKGHAPVAVPPVTGSGSTYATASAALTSAGLTPAQNKTYSATVPTGQVIGTSPPAAGPVPFGSTVTVNISLGPQPVAIPDEVGNSVDTATAALEADGLHVAGPYGPPGSTTVLSTDPAPGTAVQPGTTVNLYTL
jgi:eukaryotic-like serine/threonine-protein kinase